MNVARPGAVSAALIAALRPANATHPFPARDPDRPKGLNVLGFLAHHPALATAYHHFNGHVLFATTITPRQRELLVLRVAALRDLLELYVPPSVPSACCARSRRCSTRFPRS